MSLTPFPLIVRAVSTNPPPSFAWDGEPDTTIKEISEEYVEAFERLNPIAAVAFTLCCVEWIHWFVRPHLDSESAMDYEQYLMALWVWECGLPRKAPPDPYFNENPAAAQPTVFMQAVELGLDTVIDCITGFPDDESAGPAAVITHLCEYVLPEGSGFDTWRQKVFGWLLHRFPAGAQPPANVRVAREWFDTDLDPDALNNDAACANLIKTFSVHPNRYLPLKTPN
jgi:hypothetical protein